MKRSAQPLQLLWNAPIDRPLTEQEKDDVRERVTQAVNGMGSRFFHRTVTFDHHCKAVYATRLWRRSKLAYEPFGPHLLDMTEFTVELRA